MKKVGLQMYSIRELAQEDFYGSIKLASKAGYDGIEFAGFFDKEPKELKKHLDDLGILPCGSHTAIDLLRDEFEKTAEYNLEIGNKYIIIPYLPERYRDTESQWKKTGELMNSFNERLKKLDLKLGYHNHDFEFARINGTYAFDIFIKSMDEDILLEIDTYWVDYAGADIHEYVEKYKDRLSLLHIKDMDSKRKSTIIGEGNIDFGRIINDADMTKWFIVEQEHFNTSYEHAIEKGCRHLKNLLETK